VPWFWSDQFDAKLLTQAPDRTVVKGRAEDNSLSVFCFRDGTWLGVESVNRPGDHMAARRLLAAGVELSAEQVAAADFDLKKYANEALKAVPAT
jgi:3-phenylpropionate/trans-cinnamate dioxygenase ferredoxin reductase subunit